MNALRTYLVEDEALARKRLSRLLELHRGEVELVGEAPDAPTALGVLDRVRPDLLFLDIQLPGISGLELLSRLTYRPLVIFTTAFAEHAVRAFEENALDYLLKPVEADRLASALGRIRERINPHFQFSPEQVASLTRALSPNTEATSIPVKVGERFVFIPLDSITHFQARDKYVYLHTSEGKEYLTSHTLVSLTDKLPVHFIQVHRAYIVNRHAIREVQSFFNNRYVLLLGEQKRVRITTGPFYARAIQDVLSF